VRVLVEGRFLVLDFVDSSSGYLSDASTLLEVLDEVEAALCDQED
jgi:hypothetical protein